MPVEPEILVKWRDRVTFELFTGIDQTGQPQFQPGKQFACKISQRTRVVRVLQNGQQVLSSAKILLNPTSTDNTLSLVFPNLRSRITLPGNRTPPLVDIAYVTDERGLHHLEIFT